MDDINPLQHLIDRIPDQWGKYICVADGWHKIIIELDRQLALIDPKYEIHQVKEKFGGLRYYCTLDFDETARELIKVAEQKCDETCETCGVPGVARTGGWVKTLCDSCAAKKQ